MNNKITKRNSNVVLENAIDKYRHFFKEVGYFDESLFPVWTFEKDSNTVAMSDCIIRSPGGLLEEWLKAGERIADFSFQPELQTAAFLTVFGSQLSRRVTLPTRYGNLIPSLLTVGIYNGSHFIEKVDDLVCEARGLGSQILGRKCSLNNSYHGHAMSSSAIDLALYETHKVLEYSYEFANIARYGHEIEMKDRYADLALKTYKNREYLKPSRNVAKLVRGTKAKSVLKEGIPYPAFSLLGKALETSFNRLFNNNVTDNRLKSRLFIVKGRCNSKLYGNYVDDTEFHNGKHFHYFTSKFKHDFRSWFIVNPESDEIGRESAPLPLRLSEDIWNKISRLYTASYAIENCFANQNCCLRMKANFLTRRALTFAMILACAYHGTQAALEPGFVCDDPRIGDLAIALTIYDWETVLSYSLNEIN